jgi:hypothetical protein
MRRAKIFSSTEKPSADDAKARLIFQLQVLFWLKISVLARGDRKEKALTPHLGGAEIFVFHKHPLQKPRRTEVVGSAVNDCNAQRSSA